MVEALPDQEVGQRISLTTEADKAAKEYLYQIAHITEDPPCCVEEALRPYSLTEQRELLKQGAVLGIFPDERSVMADEKTKCQEGREDFSFCVQSVVAQYARARSPLCREREDVIILRVRLGVKSTGSI